MQEKRFRALVGSVENGLENSLVEELKAELSPETLRAYDELAAELGVSRDRVFSAVAQAIENYDYVSVRFVTD